FQQALAGWRKACEADPKFDWARQMWAVTCANQAHLEELTGHPEAALRYYREGRDHLAGLARKLPDDLGVGKDLASACFQVGRVARQLSRHAEALAALRQAVLHYERLLRSHPAARKNLVGCLSEAYGELAKSRREIGEVAQAAATALKPRALCPTSSHDL